MSTDIPTAQKLPRLDLKTKFFFGFGSIAFGAKAQVMGLLLFYYNQIVGLPAPMVSLALAISLFVDAFWDPFIGQFSDNLRTKWGRRHPLMYAAAVPVAISFVFLFHPPEGLSDQETFAYMLTMVLLVRLFTSFYEVPSAALGPELAPDYHDRTITLSFRYVFGVLGGATATSLGYFWFFRETPEYPRGQLNPEAWGPLTVVVAGMLFVSILISTAGTHHRIPQLYKPTPRKVDLQQTMRDVVATLSNWNFGVAVVAAMIAGMASGLYSGLALYFDTFFWGLPASNVGILVLTQFVSAPLAAVVGAWLSRRWGKKRACMTLFFASVVTNGGPILLRLLGVFPENDSAGLLPTLLGFRFITGILGTGGFVVVTSMIADVTEDVQVKTGRRSEGLLMSADSILQKTTSSMSALLPGLILAWVGFPEKADPGSVPPDVLRHLAMVYLPITAGISTLSIATWGFYRITQESHERNLATVQAAANAEQRLEVLGDDVEGMAPIRPPA